MSVLDLLSKLRLLGIHLSAENGQLRVKAPPGVLTPELRSELVAEKAEVLKLLQGLRAEASSQPLLTRGVTNGENIPLSFAQERLWFLDQLEPGGFTYNIPTCFRLRGKLNLPVLERSLGEIVRRHGTLRTLFKTVDGHPRQTICAFQGLKLSLFDLRELPAGQKEIETNQLLFTEARLPFDLSHGPLIRTSLIRLLETENILLISIHHISADGWSFGIIARELGVIYEAFLHGVQPLLPELPIEYVDFAVWQKNWLQGEVLERQMAYWRKQLGGSLPVMELPTDFPRPQFRHSNGATESLVLPQSLCDALQELSRLENATLSMTVMAAFMVFLQRYTGQEDIVVGMPIANRNRTEIEGLIGFFVNTLVLRTDLSGDPTFKELMGRVREVSLGAYANQDVPFEKLLVELQPERAVGHVPLFQVMFNLWNTAQPILSLPGMEPSQMQYHNAGAKVDLSLAFEHTGNGLTAWCLYDDRLWSRASAMRMLNHVENLLGSVASNPNQRLSELRILKEVERHQLLVEWNATEVAYPRDRCLHELIEEQVARTPDAVALVYEDRQLTYRQLNERANQLARYLRKLGVVPDTLVGICVERSLEMVVGLLGILKAGGAYVPLDPEYPKDRLTFMVEDAATPVLLTQAGLAGVLPPYAGRIIRLDADWAAIAGEDSGNLAGAATAGDLAYMIYTSGSTGRPKGAMNTHVAIVNRLLWMQDAYHLTPADRVVQKTPFSFDVSVWEFFWPLLTGASLIMAVPGGHRDGAYLAGLIERAAITTAHFVPSMLAAFLEQSGLETTCASLQRVICSGEALPFELQQRFFSRLPAQLHNLYGPTEAAVDVTFWPCDRNGPTGIVPIGRPIANIQIYILDRHLQPTPVGTPGELHIGGIGLARGYHNRPELTAEKFIPDPFSTTPGARLYKTGDLARYLPDGVIEYLGRLDNQVKIRGFRIELGEIEAQLSQHPAVREAVVVALEDSPGEKRLVAYLTANPGQTPPVNELRELLKARLPEYMVPSAFVTLERLPLSPNGKVDRKALPKPEMESGTTEYVPPGTPTEQALAGIWGEVLNLKRVGIDDKFFEIGGRSLLLIKVQARVFQVLEKRVSIVEMFQYPTIRALGQHLDQPVNAGENLQKSLDRSERRAQALARQRQKNTRRS